MGEVSMSLAHNTDVYGKPVRDADRKHPEYGFILALVCLALGLVVASAIFAPAAVSAGMNSESWFVGP
jgi:hypothetical protein